MEFCRRDERILSVLEECRREERGEKG